MAGTCKPLPKVARDSSTPTGPRRVFGSLTAQCCESLPGTAVCPAKAAIIVIALRSQPLHSRQHALPPMIAPPQPGAEGVMVFNAAALPCSILAANARVCIAARMPPLLRCYANKLRAASTFVAACTQLHTLQEPCTGRAGEPLTIKSHTLVWHIWEPCGARCLSPLLP